LGFALWRTQSHHPEPAAIAAAPPAAAAPRGASAAKAATKGLSAPSAQAKRVRLQVSAEPASAQIYVDGDRVANPFTGTLPKDDWQHLIEVKGEGMVAQSEWIQLNQDRTLALHLVPTPPRAPKARAIEPAPTRAKPSVVSVPVAAKPKPRTDTLIVAYPGE
jgi:hypothetical protein